MALEDPPRWELRSVSCMALESLKAKLASLPGGSTPVSNEKPVSPIQSGFRPSFNSPLPSFNTANSTSPFPTGPGTIDIAKGTLKLLNPLKEATVRPLFAKPGEEVTTNFGGLPFTITHDIVARTIEAIPNIAITTVANFRGGSVKTPFDVSRLGITDAPGQQFVQTTGDKMISKFDKLQAENPDSTGKNIALAALSPMEDALNAFILGDMLTSVARYGLKATKYSPELNKALQIYGLEGKTGDELTTEFVKQFNKKARTLTEAEDITGLNQLGEATNTIVTHMTGKGIPTLNRLGKMVQDLSRLGLQDAKGGLKLKNPLYAEIAPGKSPQALPGYVVEPGQAPAFGMSIQRVNKVGGESPSEGPFYRSKEGGKAFEEVKGQDVMPAIIKKDLDTFVVKDAEGYTVIEGKSGQALGETAKTLTEAIDSAKTQIAQLGDKLDEFVSGAKLSPRYTQVADTTPKQAIISDIKTPTKTSADIVKYVDELDRSTENPDFTSESDKGILSYTKKQIESSPTYELKTVKISDLMKKDLDLKEYVDANQQRYDGERDFFNLDNPIVIGKNGEVYDGMNRILTLKNKGVDEVKAYVPTTEKEVAKKQTSAPLNYGEKSIRIKEKVVRAKPDKLIKLAQTSSSYDDFLDRSGITEDALDMTAKKQGFDDAREYYFDARKKMEMSPEEAKQFDSPSVEQPRSEDEALELLAEQEAGSEFALSASVEEEAKIVQNLERVFADMKGVDVSDLKMKFTEEDLYMAELNYKFALDGLLDHPGRALVRFVSKKEGDFLDFKDPAKAKTSSERARIEERNERVTKAAEVAFEGTKWSDVFDDPDTIREVIEEYVTRRDSIKALAEELKSIRADIRLSKQADKFIGKESKKLASQLAGNLTALQRIVQAAERAGYRKGMSEGGEKYRTLVKHLKERRAKISALQEAYDLTDSEFARIRGQKDPRFMSSAEFDRYLSGIEIGAKKLTELRKERVIIDALISEKDLKKVDNLRKALQFNKIEDMTLAQLREFSDILSKTAPGDTFLGPRMIQTAKNTEMGDIKTMGEGRAYVAKKLGVDPASVQETSDADPFYNSFLRDPAWADLDPLRKVIFLDHTAADIQRINKVNMLRTQLEELASASRKSERKAGFFKTMREKLFSRLAPTDEVVTKYMETPEANLHILEKKMTPAQIEFGKFGRELVAKYQQYALDDAAQRWTLGGVRHSRFTGMYLPHVGPKFFERWKNNGFIEGMKKMFDGVQESKVDFNAFGDRGEVLGLEKFFKNSMTRENLEATEYSKNVASVLLNYADAFEKKIMVDAEIPKGMLLAQILGKKYRTPATITNPEGVETISANLKRDLAEHYNSWKGQKVEFARVQQGSDTEKYLQTANIAISLADLGGNLITQTASGVGGEVFNILSYARNGQGVKGYANGHYRALTPRGTKLARENTGVIGEAPWRVIADAFSDAGQTLMATMFYGFADLAYRARRQLFLGMLTKEEFKSGIVSANRLADIKKTMGEVHAFPEFRSVVGRTALLQLANKYTEWAMPNLQTSYSLLKKIKADYTKAKIKGGMKGAEEFLKSEAYRKMFVTALVGIGSYAVGQIVFATDKNETALDKWRNKAAREMGSGIQSQTGVGVIGSSRSMDIVDQMMNLISLTALTIIGDESSRYKTTGSGYEKGDLKIINAAQKFFTPAVIRQFQTKEAPSSTTSTGGRTRGSKGRSSRERKARKPRTRRQRARTRG